PGKEVTPDAPVVCTVTVEQGRAATWATTDNAGVDGVIWTCGLGVVSGAECAGASGVSGAGGVLPNHSHPAAPAASRTAAPAPPNTSRPAPRPPARRGTSAGGIADWMASAKA